MPKPQKARAPAYDKTQVMRDAHKRFQEGKELRLGWSFGQCLSTAWQAAKLRRTFEGQRVGSGINPTTWEWWLIRPTVIMAKGLLWLLDLWGLGQRL
jgi:hypothetical protein